MLLISFLSVHHCGKKPERIPAYLAPYRDFSPRPPIPALRASTPPPPLHLFRCTKLNFMKGVFWSWMGGKWKRQLTIDHVQRWNSWTAFFVEVCDHKLKSLSGFLTSVFLSSKCYSRIDSSFLVSQNFLFVFLSVFKTRVESDFL